MKKVTLILITIMAATVGHGETETIDGCVWTYTSWVSGGEHVAHITGVTPKSDYIVVPYIVVPSEFATNSTSRCRVEGISSQVFENSEIRGVEIPFGIELIGTRCFSNCGSLERIVVPSSVKNIQENAFMSCYNLKDVTWPCNFPMGYASSPWNYYIMKDVSSITNITVSDGAKEIVQSCFAHCVSAVKVTIPEGVTNIAGTAFYDCRRLPQITLPSSLQKIGEGVFARCYALTNVIFLGDAPSCEEQIFENANRDLVVYVPVGSKGWDGNPESTALPKYWPFNTEGGRRIVHIGETVNDEPHVVTNYVYSTVTNYVFSTVTNEVFHYSTVTNEIFHYTTVTNVVKYVPEPGASPDAGYRINVGADGETVIASAAGWDAFGVPDGMEWDKETGTLSGRAKLSGAYDLILVSGSGADTKIMRTTLTVAPYNTIIGYVGVAFSQSGAPLGNLKSYKTLPAGLKWKNDVLQGVPTKAQTLDLETVDSEPVTIEIKALPDSVVGTFDGCVYFPPSNPTNGVANTCDIGGVVTFTTTAAGKLSASVKTAKKTYSFSIASWTKFAEDDAFTLEASAELKTGETLQVNATVRDGATMVLAKLSGGEFGYDGCVTMLVKDVYAKSGSKWIDEEAHGLMAKCAGTYQFGVDAVEDGGFGVADVSAWTLRPVVKTEAAFLKVVLKDTGVATITGTLPDKTKVNFSAKATASAVDGSDKVEIMILSASFSGKTITLPVEINLMNDGLFAEGRTDCGTIYSMKR